METFSLHGSEAPTAVVDYAHTPDALALALQALQKHVPGGVSCVFGCGGNRDVGKRSLMGSVAVQAADKLYLTSDNPRDEDPELIVKDICQGIKGEGSVVIDLDRESAIAKAIRDAKPGALVLIAGKGHETGQTVGDVVLPFNDVEQVSVAVAAADV